jgi:large subunit ribosomal protein L19e
MVNLRLQRRLASSILGVGKKRVWMDPNEVNEVALANSRRAVSKLIKDSFIIKKKIKMHSRQRARIRGEEKRLGRHSGLGKRHGSASARMPVKILWMRRQRTLRRLLKKYREAKKIDKNMYHELYLACKASQYKSKKNLIDAIEKKIYKKNLEGKTAVQKSVLKGEEAKKPATKEEKKAQPAKQEKKQEKKVEKPKEKQAAKPATKSAKK